MSPSLSASPYATDGVTVDQLWRVALSVERAYLARQLVFRLKGLTVDYQVVAIGPAGEEILTSGVTVPDTTRFTLPDVLACQRVELRVRTSVPGARFEVFAEAGWIPVGPEVVR